MAAKKTAEFMIVNRRTGKALQAAGLENGQAVVQAAPTGEDAQLWAQVKETDCVKLVNKASGKVLDVVHGGVENGTWAQIWEDVGGGSQRWQAVKLTATYKKLLNVQSGKVLDIVDMSEEDGALAQIWEDVDGVGQQWKFVTPGEKPAAEKAGPAPAKAEEARPVKAPRACAKDTAATASMAAGAPQAAESAAPAAKAEPAKAAARKAPAKKAAGRKPAAKKAK